MVTVGDELVLGERGNENSRWMSEWLKLNLRPAGVQLSLPDDVETNIVNFCVQGYTAQELIQRLDQQGTFVLPRETTMIRAVTNLMVSETQIQQALEHIRNAMSS